ncbi:MAG: type I restriction-modification system subunit M [Bacteroidales bacterium]|nr:type I restriction-modification system subunit M [Bacteroidales bacterium]
MTEQELASMIWNVKETIRDTYDDTEVENVILPFTVLRRMDCILLPVRDSIEKELAKNNDPKMREVVLKSLMRKNNLQFYNTSGLTLSKLLDKPSAIATNFKLYLDGYTDNIKDILNNFTHEDAENGDLSKIYSRLNRENLLYQVTQQFANIDLGPDNVDNVKMGTIFEIIIRRAKETTNTKAGQFYTPRDIVRTLVSLVLTGKEDDIQVPGRHFSIYDPCCGTGGILTVAKKHIEEEAQKAGRTDVHVILNGQELNEKTYAICKSDMLLTGELQSGQIEVGDTLANDKFAGKVFNYMLANPPFGVDWKKIEKTIKAESENPDGRFSAGLPSTSDGSLLFLQHMISKMDPDNGSRIGIVLNGSPLFNGDAGSGWSNIRKSFLDRDLLDAIVAIPKSLFYSTDIATYLWILDNKKPESHKGKVLFINAADQETFSALLQKNLGKKRYSISDEATAKIVELYRNYNNASMTIGGEEVEVAKLMDNEDFLYTKVTVERPLCNGNGEPILKKGKPQPDSSLRDTERIPLKTDIDTYFKEEVLRFVPDAWMDRTKDKIGCEFPFTKMFYRYKPLRSTDEILAELMALDKEMESELSILKKTE